MFPARSGFRMPPEWYPHARTLMAWPVKEALWPEPFPEILPAYAAVVQKIAEFEPVTVIANPHLVQEAAEFCGPKVEVLAVPHNDSWIRDNGPTMVINESGEVAGVHWIFNAWGGKFPAELDHQVAPQVLAHLGLPYINAPLVMEGGSIHVDGAGTLLTTEECLLNPNRNPGLSKSEIEQQLKDYLNLQQIIWLKRGWRGDDTDGHIDNLACFLNPGLVLAQVCNNPSDPNYEVSQENLEILQQAAASREQPFEIITLEQPPAVEYEEQRLTLSYINLYFVNGGVILPTFGGTAAKTDEAAVATLEKIFPDRRIATINGTIIPRGGGNVHCLTQQIPAGKPARI
ncbi:MAG TPA: agmatine deiminase family protein [Bacillota bacterium]|nr:agmatine deiminase family protein [Bacillota bacterium]